MSDGDYNDLWNDSFNSLSQEISTLAEQRAWEFIEKGLRTADAYQLVHEALENASDTWNEEGQAALEAAKKKELSGTIVLFQQKVKDMINSCDRFTPRPKDPRSLERPPFPDDKFQIDEDGRRIKINVHSEWHEPDIDFIVTLVNDHQFLFTIERGGMSCEQLHELDTPDKELAQDHWMEVQHNFGEW